MLKPTRLLLPLTPLYAAAVALRNAWYELVPGAVRRAALPVVSVGNLTTGGTGKTPLVIEIVRHLRETGRRPAILTRGYRAARGEQADEVLEYAAAVPDVAVIVNPDRVTGAETAQRDHAADCVVLDDGFQHRRLGRDLDVVLIDALNSWGDGLGDSEGGGALLPAGKLREPLRALRRADVLVITRANQADAAQLGALGAALARYAPHAPILTATVAVRAVTRSDGQTCPPDVLAGRTLLGVCGIGNPATFERLLRSLGGAVSLRTYADHYRYTDADAAALQDAARQARAEFVVTTRKDWVKLAPHWRHAEPPLVRLDIGTPLETPAVLWERLDRLFAKS